jgi:hypothetical protein
MDVVRKISMMFLFRERCDQEKQVLFNNNFIWDRVFDFGPVTL